MKSRLTILSLMAFILFPMTVFCFDATGVWTYQESGHYNTCGEPPDPPESGEAGIIQKGNQFLIVLDDFSSVGTVSGNMYSYTDKFCEDSGTATVNTVLYLYENGTGTGTVSWTYLEPGFSCSGGHSLTATRQVQSAASYDASGRWNFTQSGFQSDCGAATTPRNSGYLDVSQSGNRVTATDDQDEEYEGIVTGGTYYLTRTEPPIGQGGTERTSYTYEALLSDNDHGQGEGEFVWDDDCDDCYGEWNLTLDRRYQNINAASSTGGTISSPGDTPVVWGGAMTYTVIPQNGYEIRDILVDGASVGAVESYTFSNVTSDHTISALFRSKGLPFLPLLLD